MLFLNKKQAIFSFFSKKSRKTFFNSIFYEIFTYQSFCFLPFLKILLYFFCLRKFFQLESNIPFIMHTINCNQKTGGNPMSDLAATNCQNSCSSGCGCGCGNDGGFNNCFWLLLILLCCNNGNDCGCGCGNDNLIWLILILCCCGNGCGIGTSGNGCGCGCGC